MEELLFLGTCLILGIVCIFLYRIRIHKDHIRPEIDYKGGYDHITKCEDCNRTGRYWDQHVANPCRRCGGGVRVIGAAKWVKLNGEYQWVKRKS